MPWGASNNSWESKDSELESLSSLLGWFKPSRCWPEVTSTAESCWMFESEASLAFSAAATKGLATEPWGASNNSWESRESPSSSYCVDGLLRPSRWELGDVSSSPPLDSRLLLTGVTSADSAASKSLSSWSSSSVRFSPKCLLANSSKWWSLSLSISSPFSFFSISSINSLLYWRSLLLSFLKISRSCSSSGVSGSPFCHLSNKSSL